MHDLTRDEPIVYCKVGRNTISLFSFSFSSVFHLFNFQIQYYEAVYLMRRYLQKIPSTAQEVATRELLQEKVRHYEQVATKLLADADDGVGNENNGTGSNTPVASPVDPRSPVDKQTFFSEDSSVVAIAVPISSSSGSNSSIRPLPSAGASYINLPASQANTRLGNALDLDERNQTEQAVAVYMQAAELFLKAIQAADQCATASDGTSAEAEKSVLLKRRLENTLDRVEQLKAIQNKTVVPQYRVGENKRVKDVDISTGPSNSALSLTKDEIAILKQSSLIASGMFLPWSDQDATDVSKSALQPMSLFTDPDGLLQLSDQQKGRFHQWARPSEIARIRYQQGFSRTKLTPVMVKAITPYTIKQQFVTDCSFIASLCICAAFERRFRKRLITNILHPQTQQGALLYNPEGKYLVKLWLNGVARCVVIDDLLPIDRHGNIICSQTTTMTTSGAASQQLELWVCLIEKAYMKLCGGYDFPGSNSGVDLFSLTGWIPERVMFAKDSTKVRDFETHPERAWERISSASTFGDCLITVSTTTEMTETQADAIGLVTGHAYAVLSVVETKSGTRILQLKNPWGRKGWTGRYSSGDSASWSNPGLCAEVGYNAELAAKQDDGIFWICWEDILQYFKNFHLSWNPSLFKFRATMHGRWPKGQGPEDDSYNVGDNPQYLLNLSEAAISRKATVWILISRHVTKQEQEGCDVSLSKSCTIVMQSVVRGCNLSPNIVFPSNCR
jgi:calpain-7